MAETAPGNFDIRRQSRGGVAPPPAHPWRRRIAIALAVAAVALAVFVSVWIWRSVTRVRAVRGRVRSEVVELAPAVDARLRELLVSDGDTVRSGQVVARLDDRRAQARLGAAKALVETRTSEWTQAKAEVNVVAAAVRADVARAAAGGRVSAARLSEAQAALAGRRAEVDEETRRAEARRSEAQAVLQQIRNRPRPQDLEIAKARLSATRAELSLCELEVQQSEKLVGEGIDSEHLLALRRTRLATQKSAVREAELTVERLQAGATQEEIDAAAQNLVACAAELALARAGEGEIEVLIARERVYEAELAAAQAEEERAQARRALVTAAREQIAAAAAELKRAEAELEAAHVAVDDMQLRSPVAGTVTRIFADVGEICAAGTAVLLVVDEATPRWIEGFVFEDDAMHVAPGQKARVRVPANRWRSVDAVVDQVAYHTARLDRGQSAGGGSAETGAGGRDRVWVRLRPLQPLPGEPVTGTSARIVIRVR